MKNLRRLVLTLAVLVVPGVALADTVPPVVTAADHVLGSAAAKVTVIEYGSVACPACAHFNETAFPQFKAKYIDTGKVRYVFRPMLTGVATVAMAGTRLAECVGNDKYFSVVDSVMRGQRDYYPTGNETDIFAHGVLVKIAKSYGLDENAFNSCVSDQAAFRRLQGGFADALADGIHSTPTFFVNGKRVDSNDLDDTVAAAAK